VDIPRLLVSTVAVAGLAGCATHARPVTAPLPTPPQREGSSFTVSRAYSYLTLADLKRDSIAAVLVHTTGDRSVQPADEEGRSRIPATITRVQVRQVVWGHLSQRLISVRQLGGAKLTSLDLPPVLSPDRDYVLLLKAFEFHPGVSTGEYYITDDQGVFDASDPAHLQRLSSQGDLPRQISLPDLAAKLRS